MFNITESTTKLVFNAIETRIIFSTGTPGTGTSTGGTDEAEVNRLIGVHNEATDAHADIRTELDGKVNQEAIDTSINTHNAATDAHADIRTTLRGATDNIAELQREISAASGSEADLDARLTNLQDLQSITISSASSYQSTLASQLGSAKPLILVIDTDIRGTRSGAPYRYSAGDVVYIPPASEAIEFLFNILEAGTGGLSEAQILALIQTWARASDTSRIPNDKLPTDLVRTPAIAGFQSESDVDDRVRLGVQIWARADNDDEIPDDKIPTNIARDSELPDITPFLTRAQIQELIGDSLFTTQLSPAYWLTANNDAREYDIALHSEETPTGTTHVELAIHAIPSNPVRQPYVATQEIYVFNFNATSAENINNQVARDSEQTIQAEFIYVNRTDTANPIELERIPFTLRVRATAPTDAAEVLADLDTERTERRAADTGLSGRITTLENAPGATSYVLPQATEAALGGVREATIAQAAATSGTAPLAWPVTKLRNRIRAEVIDWAETGNSDRIPYNKIPADLARDSDIPDVAGFQTAPQVDARIRVGVQDFAEADNTDRIPDAKLPADVVRSAALMRFQTEAQVDARVRAITEDFAEVGNAALVPDRKIPASIARTSAIPGRTAGDITVDTSSYDGTGNLAASDNTVQKVADRINGLDISSGGGTTPSGGGGPREVTFTQLSGFSGTQYFYADIAEDDVKATLTFSDLITQRITGLIQYTIFFGDLQEMDDDGGPSEYFEWPPGSPTERRAFVNQFRAVNTLDYIVIEHSQSTTHTVEFFRAATYDGRLIIEVGTGMTPVSTWLEKAGGSGGGTSSGGGLSAAQVDTRIHNHDTSTTAHADIRTLINNAPIPIVLTVSPSEIDKNNIPSHYQLNLKLHRNKYPTGVSIVTRLAGEVVTTPISAISTSTSIEVNVLVTTALRTALAALTTERTTLIVEIHDNNGAIIGDTELVLAVTEGAQSRDPQKLAQSQNEFIAVPTQDLRIYRRDTDREFIPARDQLDGNYTAILRDIPTLGLPNGGVDVDSIRLLVRGADLATTEVHRRDWTVIQDHRYIDFNISAAEENGIGPRLQRVNGRFFYHFIVVFYDGRNPVATTDAAELWLEDEARDVRILPPYPAEGLRDGRFFGFQEDNPGYYTPPTSSDPGPAPEPDPNTPSWTVETFTAAMSLPTTGWNNRIYRYAGNTNVNVILPDIETNEIGSQIGFFNDSDSTIMVAPRATDFIGDIRAIAVLPHESLILAVMRDDDWEVIADGFKANLALERIDALRASVNQLLLDFTISPSTFERELSPSATRDIVIHDHPAGRPTGATHLALTVAGTPANDRVALTAADSDSTFTLSTANIGSISRRTQTTLPIDITYYDAASGGNNLGSSRLLILYETAGSSDSITPADLALFQRRNPTSVLTLTDGVSIAWDTDDGLMAQVTLAGNRVINNPTNVQTGDVLILEIRHSGSGRTVGWGNNFRWPGNLAPTLSTAAGDRDVLTFLALSPTDLIGGPIVNAHT